MAGGGETCYAPSVCGVVWRTTSNPCPFRLSKFSEYSTLQSAGTSSRWDFLFGSKHTMSTGEDSPHSSLPTRPAEQSTPRSALLLLCYLPVSPIYWEVAKQKPHDYIHRIIMGNCHHERAAVSLSHLLSPNVGPSRLEHWRNPRESTAYTAVLPISTHFGPCSF